MPRKYNLTPARLAAARANLAKANLARQANAAWKHTASRVAASRQNAARARESHVAQQAQTHGKAGQSKVAAATGPRVILCRRSPRLIEAARRNLVKARGRAAEAMRDTGGWLRHGFTSRDFNRSCHRAGDNLDEWRRHAASFFEGFAPKDVVEQKFVEGMIRCSWRRMRSWRLWAASEFRRMKQLLRQAARDRALRDGEALRNGKKGPKASEATAAGTLTRELTAAFNCTPYRLYLGRTARRMIDLVGALLACRDVEVNHFRVWGGPKSGLDVASRLVHLSDDALDNPFSPQEDMEAEEEGAKPRPSRNRERRDRPHVTASQTRSEADGGNYARLLLPAAGASEDPGTSTRDGRTKAEFDELHALLLLALPPQTVEGHPDHEQLAELRGLAYLLAARFQLLRQQALHEASELAALLGTMRDRRIAYSQAGGGDAGASGAEETGETGAAAVDRQDSEARKYEMDASMFLPRTERALLEGLDELRQLYAGSTIGLGVVEGVASNFTDRLVNLLRGRFGDREEFTVIALAQMFTNWRFDDPSGEISSLVARMLAGEEVEASDEDDDDAPKREVEKSGMLDSVELRTAFSLGRRGTA